MTTDRPLLLKGQVWTPEGPLDGGWVLVRDGAIAAVGRAPEPPPAGAEDAADLRDMDDSLILPGFIDLHLHGFGGCSFLGPPRSLAEAVRGAAATLPAAGVTCFLAGWTGLDPDGALRFLEAASRFVTLPAAGAAVAGCYLEGPWLTLPGPLQAGGNAGTGTGGAAPHQGGRARAPVWRAGWAADPPEGRDLARKLVDRGRGLLRLITVAPELPGARAAIPPLAQAGVTVALGHTRASYRACIQAADAGATHVTHVFNRMGRWHHRRPGAAGAALLDPRLRLEVIADGLHLHPAAVELAWRLKERQGVVAVSDCLAGAAPAGDCGAGVVPGGGAGAAPAPARDHRAAPRTPDGRLAAGGTPANRMLQWLWTRTSVPPLESLDFLTRNPARVLGLEGRKGAVAPGFDADLVVLDGSFEVLLTLVGGKVAYAAGGPATREW